MDQDSQVLLSIGDVVNATVTRIAKTYIVMSLGTVNAILPVSELSWQRHSSLKSELTIGKTLPAVVISLCENKIMLSVKRLANDPWQTVDDNYHINQTIKGIVKEIKPYGAFVEIDSGVQGLLHKSVINDNPEIDINSIITEGQEINVTIISIDKSDRKIAFSLKSE